MSQSKRASATTSPRRRFGRRSFLRGGLAAGAIAPFAMHWLAKSARAATPKKALFVYIPDGCIPDRWHPSGTETSFTLPSMTEPLSAVREHLVFLDGLEMYAGGATHEGGIAKVLTGVGNQSIDVFLGQQVGADNPHKSVHLGVAANFQNGGGSVSFIGAGQEVKPDDDPINAFERLFGVTGGDDGNADVRRLRREAVLDTALLDLEGLRRRAGGSEAAKLETHQASLEEIRSRLAGGGSAACGDVVFNSAGYVNRSEDAYPKTYEKEENFEVVGRLQMDLAVLSLQCNLTRSASLMWSHSVSPTRIPGTGVGQGHHDTSHYGDPNSAQAESFVTLQRWLTDQFAYLIAKLAATPGAEGSLLDDTIVMLCSELGDGNLHDHRRVPFVMAGGGLRGNRYLDYRGTNGGENQPHTKMLVSIAQQMGVDIDSFGYTGHGTGPLDGLF